MFSVEPTLERTFFRSGAEALVATRPSLGAEELGLAAVGFLSTEGVPEGRGGVAVGLTRLGVTPAGGAAPGTVALFFTELVEVLFGRLTSAAKVGVRDNRYAGKRAKGALKPWKRWGFKSGIHEAGDGVLPGADFVAIFLMSAGFPSVLTAAQTYTF